MVNAKILVFDVASSAVRVWMIVRLLWLLCTTCFGTFNYVNLTVSVSSLLHLVLQECMLWVLMVSYNVAYYLLDSVQHALDCSLHVYGLQFSLCPLSVWCMCVLPDSYYHLYVCFSPEQSSFLLFWSARSRSVRRAPTCIENISTKMSFICRSKWLWEGRTNRASREACVMCDCGKILHYSSCTHPNHKLPSACIMHTNVETKWIRFSVHQRIFLLYTWMSELDSWSWWFLCFF